MIDHDNLEEFRNPKEYDIRDSSTTGLDFYAALAKECGAPILEIACGTGRISIPIAKLGYQITGLDIVPGMLEQAKQKSAGLPINWIERDGRSFDLDEQFRLVFLTGNAFQAFLTRADQESLLECAHKHLHDDGLFAFETRNPRWPQSAFAVNNQLAQDSYEKGLFVALETDLNERPGRSFTDEEGHQVRVSRTQVYNHLAQILELTTYRRWQEGNQEQMKTSRIALRFTFPQELETLLYYNGFTIVRQYGDWNKEPLSASSLSIISICRKLE